MTQNTSTIEYCQYCGGYHPNQLCWRIKEILYYPNGQVKKVILEGVSKPSKILENSTSTVHTNHP